MLANGQRQCEATRKDGQPCQGWAGRESRFCFVHDPVRARERAKARQKGGRSRNREHNLANAHEIADERYRTLAELETLLEETINEARRLKAGEKKVRALGYLIGQWARLYELGQLAERVAALEEWMQVGKL